jgi:hypothetical protein
VTFGRIGTIDGEGPLPRAVVGDLKIKFGHRDDLPARIAIPGLVAFQVDRSFTKTKKIIGDRDNLVPQLKRIQPVNRTGFAGGSNS